MQQFGTLQRSIIEIPKGAKVSIKQVGSTDGYDGHSLRAFAYFGESMPDIDPNSVESINSIQARYKDFRQDSKAPTFALTYQGTYITLMTNCGFSLDKAKMVEAKYHDLYKVSDDWVASKLDEACKNGYVTVAFGLRVRTPLLHQVVRGNSKTPFEAEAEGRTAGNALGQSYCMLNTRAGTAFLKKVREQRREVYPCAQIHDAQYFLARRDPEVIHWVNENLIPEMEWQDWPEIQHPEVGLGGELDVFKFSWAHGHTLKNHCSLEDVRKVLNP